MKELHNQNYFAERCITLPDPWQEPALKLLHYFRSLPNLYAKFGKAGGPNVRCSPELGAFILGNTPYKHHFAGPDPEAAFRHLLRTCFPLADIMFQGACSPFQLLCRSHFILDMAFVRAVLAASHWLGPLWMPVGYISAWPPAQSVAAV